LGFNFKKINKEKIVHGASNKEHWIKISF
jgi:hypothetical protein